MVQTVMTDASILEFIQHEESIATSPYSSPEEYEQSFHRVHAFIKRGLNSGSPISPYLTQRMSALVSLYPADLRHRVIERVEGVPIQEYLTDVVAARLNTFFQHLGIGATIKKVDLSAPAQVAETVAPMLAKVLHQALADTELQILNLQKKLKEKTTKLQSLRKRWNYLEPTLREAVAGQLPLPLEV
jgi:hypothetical protein